MRDQVLLLVIQEKLAANICYFRFEGTCNLLENHWYVRHKLTLSYFPVFRIKWYENDDKKAVVWGENMHIKLDYLEQFILGKGAYAKEVLKSLKPKISNLKFEFKRRCSKTKRNDQPFKK